MFPALTHLALDLVRENVDLVRPAAGVEMVLARAPLLRRLLVIIDSEERAAQLDAAFSALRDARLRVRLDLARPSACDPWELHARSMLDMWQES